SSDDEWEKRVRDLRYRDNETPLHEVSYVEKVILPDWMENECPWCKEEEALATLLNEDNRLGQAQNALNRRRNLLVSIKEDQGLKDNALWCVGDKPRLTPNSIFLEHNNETEADVIVAVAAALQQMRNSKDEKNKLETAYPHITVIDSEDYLGDTFSDNILRLAIIRVAKRSELERWRHVDEEHRRTVVRNYLTGQDQDTKPDEVCFELAVAMLDHKLPKPALSESDWENLKGTEYGSLIRRIINAWGH
ncbi:MAG: hypothetical protein ACRD82_09725, partial [Blastocatellia bacterium]